MKKIKIFLFYFFLSIVIFILIFVFANSPLGKKEIPPYFGFIEPGQTIEYETNPIFWLTNENSCLVLGFNLLGKFTWSPLIFYWYFLSLLITFLLYKIIRSRQLKLQSTKYLAFLVVIIIGVIAYSIYWSATIVLE